MATLETFNFTATELAERYTMTAHGVLNYLFREKMITEAQTEELFGRLIVTAVPNKPGWGSKILRRLGFGDKSEENSWIFPIVLLPKIDEPVELAMKRKMAT